jgi:type IV pilus assembly protein PilY1
VLIVIDISAGMEQAGIREPYNPAKDYSKLADGSAWGAPYTTNGVYVRVTATGGTINYNSYISSLTGVTCAPAVTALTANGYYAGTIKKSDGSCNAPQPGNYYLGNLLNYLNYPSSTPAWTASTAYAAGATARPATSFNDANGNPVEFQVITGGTSGASQPDFAGWYACKQNAGCTDFSSDPNWPYGLSDGTVVWGLNGSIIDMVKSVVSQVVEGSRNSVNFGLMVFGQNNHGGAVLRPIDDVSTGTVAGVANYAAFNTALDGITLLNANAQRVNETLWDAYMYYTGQNSSTDKIASERTSYPSPIKYGCQFNFLILLTTGNADDNVQTKNLMTDLNEDGVIGLVDDAANLLFSTDLDPDKDDPQVVRTHIIQLLTPEVDRLSDAADQGGGSYFKVNNTAELTEKLLDVMSNVVKEVDTAFVAPVVPTSPENRTYSGQRVYLGFFKPVTQKPWRGNLKKFGINSRTEITDADGNVATDSDGNFVDGSRSFWSTTDDAGEVEKGGAGEVLLNRNFAADPRLFYSNLTADADLTAAANRFNSSNVTPAMVGVATTAERNAVINYMHGYDIHDDDNDGSTDDKRSWIFGDILHSKPQIVNYNTYTFNTTNEGNPDSNKTVIFVGTNDGMLHAIRDADGKELWAFVPKRVMANLGELIRDPAQHTYYVDASPLVWVHDSDNDGNIGPYDGDSGSTDKVILFFGLRRGGDAYYALDVTNPVAPRLLWEITPSTTGFERLGETWSDPQFGKMKIGTADKIVAFFGAGYDQAEDSRFGWNWTFPSDPMMPKLGNSLDPAEWTSEWYYNPSEIPDASSSTGYRIKGRAVYVLPIADVTSGTPTVAATPTLLKAFGSDDEDLFYDNDLDTPWVVDWYLYPFASDIAVLDTDYDGYVDRLYAPSTGGQLWRFDVGSTDAGNWKQRVVFWDYEGAKFFYRPSLTFEPGYTFLFMGTGDREHPLNVGVTNRLIAFKDRDALDPNYPYYYVRWYYDLENVTGNELQLDSTPASTVDSILGDLKSSANVGWYIDLNERSGEKVLASPLAFNKVTYFTTYAPNTVVSADPCEPGNLGSSRLYAVDYKTGEAVLNFDKSNDIDEASVVNKRAVFTKTKTLRRSDRSIELGVGIPSGLVVVMPPGGDAELLIGCGGGLCSEDPLMGGTIIPIYWMQW